MRIHNLYVDSAGESHFRDIEVELREDGLGGMMSKRQAAPSMMRSWASGSVAAPAITFSMAAWGRKSSVPG